MYLYVITNNIKAISLYYFIYLYILHENLLVFSCKGVFYASNCTLMMSQICCTKSIKRSQVFRINAKYRRHISRLASVDVVLLSNN